MREDQQRWGEESEAKASEDSKRKEILFKELKSLWVEEDSDVCMRLIGKCIEECQSSWRGWKITSLCDTIWLASQRVPLTAELTMIQRNRKDPLLNSCIISITKVRHLIQVVVTIKPHEEEEAVWVRCSHWGPGKGAIENKVRARAGFEREAAGHPPLTTA